MSEIKGQILGVILVLLIFGAVATAMTTVFQNMTDQVTETVGNIDDDLARA